MNRREFLITTGALAIAAAIPGDACAMPETRLASGFVGYNTPYIARVQYYGEAWLPQACLPAKFYRYREEYRACDVWRITCEYGINSDTQRIREFGVRNQYGLERCVTDFERANLFDDVDIDALTRGWLIEALDENMCKVRYRDGRAA